MKKINRLYLIGLLVAFSIAANAQKNVAKIGTNPTTIGASSVLELESSSKALLISRVPNTAAVAFPINGMIIYDIEFECFKAYQDGSWSGCNLFSPATATLDCLNVTVSGTLTAGINANGVTGAVPYSAGNGGIYAGQIVSSTGVTGLSATILGGTLASGTGTISFYITGTPSSAGTASFVLTVGSQTCAIDVAVEEGGPVLDSIACGSGSLIGTLTANVAASGVFETIAYTGGNGVAYNTQFISSTGVTGLTAILNSGTLSNGTGGSFTFSIAGTPSAGGVASFNFVFGGQSCSFSVNVNEQPAIVNFTSCSAASSGTLTAGVAASGVTQTATYSGGNGANYPAITFPSSGVTGLTANLAAGNLANGTGSIIFTITGTPSAAGTATFNITLFGTTCSFTRPVASPPAVVSTLNCGSATFSPATVTQGISYTGTASVPYTGGNSSPYSAGTGIASTGVTGLTATLVAGTLTSSTGNLTYNVSGTPSAAGTASFALSFGGQTCTLNVTVVSGFPPVYTTTTTILSGNHLTTSIFPFLYDDRITYASQDVTVGDMLTLRMHQDAVEDVLRTVFSQSIIPGGKVVIRWSRVQSVGNVGMVAQFAQGGTTSQPSVNTLTNVLPNSTSTASGNDMTLTINVVSLMNTLTLRSSADGRGEDPIILEIEVFDNNNVKIPVN